MYSGYEYATLKLSFEHVYFSNVLDTYVHDYYLMNSPLIIYSEHYNDNAWLKQHAVDALHYGVLACDMVESISVEYAGDEVLCIYRWMEYLGYQPQ